MENSTKKEPPARRSLLLRTAFVLFLGLAIFSAAQIVLALWEYAASKNEYDKLRDIYEPAAEAQAEAPVPEEEAKPPQPLPPEDTPEPAPAEEEEEAEEAPPPAPPRSPAEINAEYIGWLKISGTVINYPIAQGADNDKYLHTSFEGRKSGLGAIFMDYRCAGDFKGYHSILYGHNVKRGTMFGSLAKFQDAAYLESHREITITLPDGSQETWRIFAARKSDINDYAYRLKFSGPESFAVFATSLGAPEGVSRLLTLSTCTTGGSNEERMLVHAALVE
jgi:sortase B